VAADAESVRGMKSQPPVLFLDIDGVMRVFPSSPDSHPDTGFTTRAVSGLREIVASTACDIVVSSTWRVDSMDVLNQVLGFHGLGIAKSRVIGVTPFLDPADNPTRVDEIDYWLSDHRFKGRMAILDDEILEGDLRPWQVLTFQETGLTPRLAQRAIQLLKAGTVFGQSL